MKDFRLHFYIFTIIKMFFFPRHKAKYSQKNILRRKKDFAQRKRRHNDNNQIVSCFKKVKKKVAAGSLKKNQWKHKDLERKHYHRKV